MSIKNEMEIFKKWLIKDEEDLDNSSSSLQFYPEFLKEFKGNKRIKKKKAKKLVNKVLNEIVDKIPTMSSEDFK